MKPIERAYQSLLGVWVGDAFGGHFEFEHVDWERPRRAFEKRDLPPSTWRYTDDTQMALSIYECLKQDNNINPDKLAESFIQQFDISRGYGIGTEDLLVDMQKGGDWSSLAPARFDGNGSYGNGSAMRVTPIGAFFADDFKKVVENARQSSIVTHTHPDAIAGTIAVAIASAQMSRFAIQKIRPTSEAYWQTLIQYTPSGNLQNKLSQASQLSSDISHFDVAKELGCGWDVSALDTVPFALWCAIQYVDIFDEALWHTISVGGDADTTGAIVGGVIASYGDTDYIPKEWRARAEPLPDWLP